jgi:hypothetical protein
LVLLAVCICLGLIVPGVWASLEDFAPGADYRLPYLLSDDYWLFTRWCKYASGNYEIVLVGDSVVWGQYVAPNGTLSHHLNRIAGRDLFANLGVDGLHPAALAGLVERYGDALDGRGIILHLNPMWMSSDRHDLRRGEQNRLNHPRLLPQFDRGLVGDRESLAGRLGIVCERSVDILGLVSHVKTVYFEDLDIQSWTMESPYRNPLGAITFRVPAPDNRPKSRPVSWYDRRIGQEDLPWPSPESSSQWQAFKRVVEKLGERGNEVLVLVGPYNPHVLTGESRHRYIAARGTMEAWLEDNGVSYHTIADLPSEWYADASHPLEAGYGEIARSLSRSEVFGSWMDTVEKGKLR